MSQVLAGLPGVHNLHDDIIVAGSTMQDLQDKVEATVRRLQEHRLTLNYDKCIAGVQKLNYMGITLTSDGIKVDENKVKAVTEAKGQKASPN